jgi:phosphohistidine swiveling domain-containing protein
MECLNLNTALSVDQVGEKAFNLSKMIQAGLPIPQGMVLTNTLFENKNLQEYKTQIKKELSVIAATGYMVRSSAIGEDGDTTSFAGQLDSFIVSNNIDDILLHVKKCWDSYYSENVLVYQKAKEKKLAGMGVIIQELIEPDYAGVLFTESHLQENSIMIEYVQGHGEKLVSGEVNPKGLSINKNSLKASEKTPFSLTKLVELSLNLEKDYTCAVDIEWVVKNNELYIVQCRPVTVKCFVPDVYWSNTNVNENYPEAITPLLYSIARSSYYHYFKNLSKLLQIPEENIQKLEKDYTNIIGAWGAKMYYNMSSIHRVISSSPFAKLLLKSFNNFVGYQNGEKEEPRPIQFKSKRIFIQQLLKLNQNLDNHVLTFENRVNEYQESVSKAFTPQLLQKAYHEFIEIRMHSWYHASLADFFAMIFHGVLGKFCDSYYGDKSEGIRNQLIQAIPNLVSSIPVQETWRVSNLIRENDAALELFKKEDPHEIWSQIQYNQAFKLILENIKKYIKNWGFRCSGELMLTEENYIDAPHKYIELLKGYLKQVHGDPYKLIHKKHLESLSAFKSFKQKIYLKNPLLLPLNCVKVQLFKFVVRQAKKGISSRERVRLKQALIYNEFKTVIKRIRKLYPEKFPEKNDLYFLKYQEIEELLSGSEILPNLSIKHRKAEFIKTSKLIYPDDFKSKLGLYPQPESVTVKTEAPIGNVLNGLTACGGFVKGRARVLSSVLEAQKLEKGDILITRQTDPGWASVFPLISGLVVERGGMLSHGAIVSREFGIPAVVGVPNATKRIIDGSLIEIKADTGEVILHD